MIDQHINTLIHILQSYPSEIASLLTFLVCVLAILGACRYGYGALCAYNALAIVIANVQVLRLGSYLSTPEPVALGTVLFATTYLVSDIITEHYGADAARKTILISFMAQLLASCWMLLCLAHPGVHDDPEQDEMFKSMWAIFVPSARLFIASLLSYVVTQLIDISLYQWIRRKSAGRYLWLRQNVSMFASGFLDNLLFSVLAWIVLNPNPLSFNTVIMSYVLAGCIIRIAVNIMGTPVLYWSYRFVKIRRVQG
ncbi:MAG: queuosine precursor transporter [Pseudomonadota bacterium]